ncbi:MAG: hypothetical protein ACOYON_04605 [Fimbriimonas sp.]
MASDPSSPTAHDKRIFIGPAFLGVLYGLSIQELMPSAKVALNSFSTDPAQVSFAVVAFLTIFRFFVGASLFLFDPRTSKRNRNVWLMSFLVLVMQATGFVFLAGIADPAQSKDSPVAFPDLLHGILVLDIVWVGLLGLDSLRLWLREKVYLDWPWAWGLFNMIWVLAGLFLARIYPANSTGFLGIFGSIHVLAFIIDIVLIDHHDLLAGDPTP